MIRRLIILLLIVGCAPTKPPTATFYIGITKDEFRENNPNISHDPLKIDEGISIENEGSFNEYIFIFENDSLSSVYHNIWNMAIQKEIDYDKYATPPE